MQSQQSTFFVLDRNTSLYYSTNSSSRSKKMPILLVVHRLAFFPKNSMEMKKFGDIL